MTKRKGVALAAGLLLAIIATAAACGVANTANNDAPATVSNANTGNDTPPANDSPDPPDNGEKSGDPEVTEPGAIPKGVLTPQGLKFVLPYPRGDGSLLLSMQNDHLRLDFDIRQPYYAGNIQGHRGSMVQIALSVNGLEGRRMSYYPAPLWFLEQPRPVHLLETQYKKDAPPRTLAEQTSHAGRANLKFWDRWQATVYIELARLIIPGNDPTPLADDWRMMLSTGHLVAPFAFPSGSVISRAGQTAEKMITFRLSDLPERDELDDDPVEALRADEEMFTKALKDLNTRMGAVPALSAAKLRAMSAEQRGRALRERRGKMVRIAFDGLEALKKVFPNQLFPYFGQSYFAQLATHRSLPGVPEGELPLLKAYLEACPGQAQPHFDYLVALLSAAKVDQARAHYRILVSSPLSWRKTGADIRKFWAGRMIDHGFPGEALEVMESLKKTELYADEERDGGSIEQGRSLAKSMDNHHNSWLKELEFRKEDKARGSSPRLILETTKGRIVIELFEDDAPNTVASLVSLAQKGFYDGLQFHRYVPGFVIQGGDPRGDGSGGPGYRLKSEDKNAGNRRRHFRTMVAMACSLPGKATEGSQFYICLSHNESVMGLAGKYVVVGRVIEGMENAEKLRVGDKMTKVTASNLRDHEYKPDVIK